MIAGVYGGVDSKCLRMRRIATLRYGVGFNLRPVIFLNSLARNWILPGFA